MSIAEVEKMSTSERLEAMEVLWDSLCRDSDESESPEWHGQVLEERRRRIESGEAKFVSLEEARCRFQS